MDALASVGDEGRGLLRKASGSRKQALIRRCPNGETRRSERPSPERGQTRGIETSQYPEEEKENSIPSVVASESGTSLNLCLRDSFRAL